MSKTFVSAIFGLMCIVLAGCEQMAPVRDVAWYQDPANADALVDILKRGKENPGQYKDNPNYINAYTAANKKYHHLMIPAVLELDYSEIDRLFGSGEGTENLKNMKKNLREDHLREIYLYTRNGGSMETLAEGMRNARRDFQVTSK